MGTLFLLLKEHDERALHAMIARRRQLLDRGMRAITHLGDAKVVIAIAAGLMLAPVPTVRAIGYEVAFVLSLSHVWVQILKRAVSRPRPHLPVGAQSLIEAPDRFSFPSGHAAASLSLALPLAPTLTPLLSAVICSVSALVGLSRCYLGVHYPGDVAMGWILAGLAAWAATPALAMVVG